MTIAKITKSQMGLAFFLRACAQASKSRNEIIRAINDGKGLQFGDFRARIDDKGVREPRTINWLNSQVKLLLGALDRVAHGGVEKQRTIVKDASTGEDTVAYKEVKVDAHDAESAKMATELRESAKMFYVKGTRGKSGVKVDAAKIAKAFQDAIALDF